MKVLVLGSNSFSASHFISRSLQNNAEVLGISRSSLLDPCFLPFDPSLHAQNFKFCQLDINQDLEYIKAMIKRFKPNVVANFAAQGMVAQSWENPLHWYDTNISSSVAIIEFLKQCDFLDRYLQISTPEVYGPHSQPIQPTHQFSPSTPYAISKACLDEHLRVSLAYQDFPVVFTRAANFYGPGQQLYRVIPKAFLTFLAKAKFCLDGGGHALRSFIYIDDVVEGYWKAATEGEIGAIYHFAYQEMISIKSLIYLIAGLCHLDPSAYITNTEERLGKDKAYALSIEDTTNKLGWAPKIDLQTGLINTFQWIRAHHAQLNKLPWEYIHKA